MDKLATPIGVCRDRGSMLALFRFSGPNQHHEQGRYQLCGRTELGLSTRDGAHRTSSLRLSPWHDHGRLGVPRTAGLGADHTCRDSRTTGRRTDMERTVRSARPGWRASARRHDLGDRGQGWPKSRARSVAKWCRTGMQGRSDERLAHSGPVWRQHGAPPHRDGRPGGLGTEPARTAAAQRRGGRHLSDRHDSLPHADLLRSGGSARWSACHPACRSCPCPAVQENRPAHLIGQRPRNSTGTATSSTIIH